MLWILSLHTNLLAFWKNFRCTLKNQYKCTNIVSIWNEVVFWCAIEYIFSKRIGISIHPQQWIICYLFVIKEMREKTVAVQSWKCLKSHLYRLKRSLNSIIVWYHLVVNYCMRTLAHTFAEKDEEEKRVLQSKKRVTSIIVCFLKVCWRCSEFIWMHWLHFYKENTESSIISSFSSFFLLRTLWNTLVELCSRFGLM